MKLCKKCNTRKQVSEFSPNGKTPSGTKLFRSSCKECERERDKKRMSTDPARLRRKAEGKARAALHEAQQAAAVKEKKLGPQMCQPTGRFTIDTKSGCFVSSASRGGEWYGRLIVDGKPVGHHRHVAAVYADIEGMDVHHKCRNPACVNPAHLEVLTPEDHIALHAADTLSLRSGDISAILEFSRKNPEANRKVIAQGIGIAYQRVCTVLRDAGIEVSRKHTR